MRTAISTALVLVALGAGAVPANAQNQGVTFTFGYFAPKGEDGRVAGDVLNADRCLDVTFQCEPLLFNVSDFGGLTFSGEYSIGLGEVLRGGLRRRLLPADRAERLRARHAARRHPKSSRTSSCASSRSRASCASCRPAGTRAVQPYIGVGVAALNWHYTESGEFVDPSDSSIFRAQYIADGTEVAPVVVGGLRAPMGDGVHDRRRSAVAESRAPT